MKKFIYKITLLLTLLSTPLLTFANTTNSGNAIPSQVFDKFAEIVSSLIQYYLMFAGLIWIVFLLIHGLGMLGKSDSRSKEEAKDKLLTTLKVGIWVLLLPALAAFMLSLVHEYITTDDTFNGAVLKESIQRLNRN